MLVSPWPYALWMRRDFAAAGRARDAALAGRAPSDVVSRVDVRYGEGPDELLDVYWPSHVDGSDRVLPTVVWVHGGGWLGGSKEELANYLRMLAARGFTAVAPRYSLSPGAKYPTPVRQTMTALRFLADQGEHLHVDGSKFVLAGDSAGAHICAQIAAIVTDRTYAHAVGVVPGVEPQQLRGLVACCGPYDLVATSDIAAMRTFFTAIVWSYSGTRRFRDDPYLATAAVVRNVTEAFPPTFLTVGNDDPLREHSYALAGALRAKGVDVDTLFYPADHQPALAHEYQFDLDLDDAGVALERMVSFITAHTR
jgi:acetyl esterase